MARDQYAAERRTLDDVHGPESVRSSAHCDGGSTEGKLAEVAVRHSQPTQIGFQEFHLPPTAEESWIGERCLGTRLPSGMEAIEARQEVPVGTPGTRSGLQIKGLLDPLVRERRLGFEALQQVHLLFQAATLFVSGTLRWIEVPGVSVATRSSPSSWSTSARVSRDPNPVAEGSRPAPMPIP